MAIENDNNDDVQEQQGQEQQVQEQDNPTLAPASVDAALEQFVKDSERAPTQTQQRNVPGQTPNDPNAQQQQGRSPQQQGQGDKQPTRQQPQQDQPVRGTAPTSRMREFGKRYYRDSSSNIVDRETNKVVAKAGAPYAVASSFLPYITKLEGEIEQAQTRMKAFEDARAVGREAGLTIEEDALGTRLMVAYKKDPIATIKYLLTQAQEQGNDVSSLTSGQTFDTGSLINNIKTQIAEAMQPFMFIVNERQAQQQQMQEQEEARVQAEQEVQEFIEQFPDAKVQDAEIGALMASQGWTMREAYFALKSHAAENRLDWSKPIGQQIAARRSATPAPNGGGRGNRQQRLPDMSGRGGNRQSVRADARESGADADFASIIKDVLGEHGIEA